MPYNRLKDEQFNAYAFTDEEIGSFVERMRESEHWDNTLIVIIPDHGCPYPNASTYSSAERHQIPMVWVGGAIKEPLNLEDHASQTDLAATLLGQMDIRHDDFKMSRDVLSETYTLPFAVNSWSQGVVMTDHMGSTIYDLNTKKVSNTLDAPPASHAESIKVYLQKAYMLLK